MVATVAIALIGVATAIVNGVASNSTAQKQKDAQSDIQETIRQEQNNQLTANIFATSSASTSKGWSELLNVEDVPQTTVLAVMAVLAILILVKSKK